MWDILHTLRPMVTKNLINKALENRGLENEEDKDNMIEIAPQYLDKLIEVAVRKEIVQILTAKYSNNNLNLYYKMLKE